MSATLICTECFEDTGITPDFPKLTARQIVRVVSQWRCNRCLDEFEATQQPAADGGG